MNCLRLHFLFIALLLTPPALVGQTIRGNVQNGTTGEAEAAHEVVLVSVAGEQARTVTDAKGDFELASAKPLDLRSPMVLEVVHDGVQYFKTVVLGKRNEVQVYAASRRVESITDYLSMLQFQAENGKLWVTELHALRNTSNPPITKLGSSNLILQLPEGSEVQPATVSGPDGARVAVTLAPVPQQKNRYSIDFPLKPGLTKYAVSYDVPYHGKISFDRKAQYPMARLGIIIPATMRFRSLGAKVFIRTTQHSGVQQEALENIKANESFGFELAGRGELDQFLQPLHPGERSRRPPALLAAIAPEHLLATTRSLASSAQPSKTTNLSYMALLITVLACAGIPSGAILVRKLSRFLIGH